MGLITIAAYVLAEGVLLTSECGYDKFMPEYQSVMSMTRSYFRHLSLDARPTGFTVEIRLQQALYIMLQMCRDGKLRREAVQILRLNRGREGIWDGGLVAILGEWLIKTEEKELAREGHTRAREEGYINEQDRIRIIKVYIDTTGAKKAHGVFMKQAQWTAGLPQWLILPRLSGNDCSYLQQHEGRAAIQIGVFI